MNHSEILVNDPYNLVPELFIAYSNLVCYEQANIDVLPLTCKESFQPSTNFTIFIDPEPNIHCSQDFFQNQLCSRPNSIFAVSGFNLKENWSVPYILNFANLTMTVRVNLQINSVEIGSKKYLANALLGGWSKHRGRILSQLIKENLDKECLINYNARTVVPEQDRQNFTKQFPDYALSYRSLELDVIDNSTFLKIAFDTKSEQNLLVNTCRPIPNMEPYQHAWVSQLIPYEVYNRSYISIVAETEAGLDAFFISEKIAKPLILAQPFVVFGGRHYLKHLRDLGFQTFHPWIDESYDDIEDEDRRIDQMVLSVKRFSHLSESEKIDVMNNLVSVVEHNRRLVLDYSWTTKTIADAIINFSTS